MSASRRSLECVSCTQQHKRKGLSSERQQTFSRSTVHETDWALYTQYGNHDTFARNPSFHARNKRYWALYGIFISGTSSVPIRIFFMRRFVFKCYGKDNVLGTASTHPVARPCSFQVAESFGV